MMKDFAQGPAAIKWQCGSSAFTSLNLNVPVTQLTPMGGEFSHPGHLLCARCGAKCSLAPSNSVPTTASAGDIILPVYKKGTSPRVKQLKEGAGI